MTLDQSNSLMDCSLASLRAFREAAKRRHFTLAAARMSVTPSAISHHIKTLERQLNTKLFDRRGNQLHLTNEGRLLYNAVDASFTRLADAIEHIHAGRVRQRVILGVLSSFASKWLLPRLGGFYRTHRDIELVVRSVNHTIDPERERVDLAVVTLPSPPLSPRVAAALMWREQLFAVCSPTYATAADAALRDIADLSHHPLLHDETEIAAERGLDWQTWLRHFNAESVLTNAASHYFSQSDLTLQAAIAGHGIALTRTSIAATDIQNGLLTNPFPDRRIATQSGCYLCGEKSAWEKRGASQLRDWLLTEAGVAQDSPLKNTKHDGSQQCVNSSL